LCNPCRLYVVLLVAFAVFPPAPAMADRGVEITPIVGFRFGGSFEDNTTGATLEAGQGESYGLILGLRQTDVTWYELYYSYQRTELDEGGLVGAENLFDLDIHYLHLGGTYLFPGERVHPFIGGGLGLTFFAPDGPGLNAKTYFSLSLGGGAKVPITKTLGLRIEGRGFLTILPDQTDIFCVSYGGAVCNVRVQGDVFGQVELLVGISFGL
jgi:hypothetical protein